MADEMDAASIFHSKFVLCDFKTKKVFENQTKRQSYKTVNQTALMMERTKNIYINNIYLNFIANYA